MSAIRERAKQCEHRQQHPATAERGKISGGVKLHASPFVKLPSCTNAGDPDAFLSSTSAPDGVVKTLSNYAQFGIKTPENAYRSRAGDDRAPLLCLDINPGAHARKRTYVRSRRVGGEASFSLLTRCRARALRARAHYLRRN